MKKRAFTPPASARRPDAANTAAHPLEWAAGAGAVSDVLREMNVRLRRQRRRRIQGVVASLALLFAIGLGWKLGVREPVAPPARGSVAPIVSLPRTQTLADGTVVEFRSDAHIAVAFEESVRRVVLTRGEVHFKVAKNPARPFVVSAGGVDFRAVGTAFTVNLAEAKVEMFVTEGKVAVAAAPQSTAVETPAVVEAGNHVLVAIDGTQRSTPVVTPVSPAQLNQRLAWRAPKLEFTATPLGEAVDTINQLAAGRAPRIKLGNAALAEVRISGILRADNIETLVGLLEADYGIRADRNGDSEIILHKADGASR
jgi:transmembrane sensor